MLLPWISIFAASAWQARIAIENLGPGRRIFVDLSKDSNVDWEKASHGSSYVLNVLTRGPTTIVCEILTDHASA